MTMKTDVDSLDDESLAYVVAEARGCKPTRSEEGVYYCPCPGMPHGMALKFGGLHINPKLHHFPKDVALGFLNGKKLKLAQVDVRDGISLCKVVMDAQGRLGCEIAIPIKMRSAQLLFGMRGALKTIDADLHKAIQSYKTGKPVDDIDEMLGAVGEDEEPGPEDY
jgi:hypothetical protein